jgi:hypothetical protein
LEDPKTGGAEKGRSRVTLPDNCAPGRMFEALTSKLLFANIS